MTKLIVAFRNFAKAPKKGFSGLIFFICQQAVELTLSSSAMLRPAVSWKGTNVVEENATCILRNFGARPHLVTTYRLAHLMCENYRISRLLDATNDKTRPVISKTLLRI
jgi:hypothetical protein